MGGNGGDVKFSHFLGDKMRVTVDLDYPSELQFLKVFFTLKLFTNIIEVFRTKKGYHLQAYDFPELTEGELYEFRRFLGDDENRVFFDEELHGKPEQVLFTRRHGRVRERLLWENIVALPWKSTLPTRKKKRQSKNKAN